MSDDTDEQYEGWAIVEIMGRRRIGEQLAEAAYIAWCASVGWKSFTGEKLPLSIRPRVKRPTATERGQPMITAEPEPIPAGEPAEPGAEPDGQWLCIAFMGHNEYTGYVTEIVKNGQPGYHVDLPGKIWGGSPLAYVEYAATAWFSDRPVTEASVRAAYEAQLARAAGHARIQAGWRRADELRELPVPVILQRKEAGDDDDEVDAEITGEDVAGSEFDGSSDYEPAF